MGCCNLSENNKKTRKRILGIDGTLRQEVRNNVTVFKFRGFPLAATLPK